MLHHELIQHTNASQILGRSFSLAAHIQTCRLLNINADQREPPCALTQVKEGRQGQKRADTGRKFGGGRRRIWRFWMEDSWHICALCRLCAPDGRGTQTDGRTGWWRGGRLMLMLVPQELIAFIDQILYLCHVLVLLVGILFEYFDSKRFQGSPLVIRKIVRYSLLGDCSYTHDSNFTCASCADEYT